MDDLISRNDSIDLVKYHMKHNPMRSVEFIQGLQDAYLRVISDLDRLSPVDAIPIEWIKEQKDKCFPYLTTALVLNGLITEWERRNDG